MRDTSWTLCPNELSARLWRAQYQRDQQQAGQSAWEAPRIASLSRWVRSAWLASWPDERLLSRIQEQWLWQQLLQQDPIAEQLLAPQAMVRQLQQTWALCHAWHIDPLALPHWTPEQAVYARLHQAFHAELHTRSWITTAQLGAALRNHPGGRTVLPAERWLGPAAAQCNAEERALLNDWGLHADARPARPSGQWQAMRCADPTAQWTWIADQLQRILDREPQARIVVAAAELEQHKDLLDIVWRPRLAPWACQPGGAADAPLPWTVEHPEALLDQPAIAALSALCQLTPRDNSFATLQHVLAQPLFFQPEERSEVMRAERTLRTRGVRFSANDLVDALPDSAPDTLRTRLRALVQCVNDAPHHASPERWVRHWQQRWAALPWQREVSSWRVEDTLERALIGFTGLSDLLPSLSLDSALQWFSRALREQKHSASGAVDGPIVVCSLEQAVALPCSHLIVAGVDQSTWPGARPQQPWLNPELLRASDWPAATPQQWLQAQQQRWHQLQQMAPNLICVSSASDAQGTERGLPLALDLAWSLPADPASGASPRMELAGEDQVEPLCATRLDVQTGGANLLRRQARSPFAAFVHHRLGARELPPPLTGLSPAQQGEWVHAALATFWRDLQTSDRLAALADGDLDARLEACVAADQARFVPPARYGQPLALLETERVWRTVRRWVRHERLRDDPFTVLHCEAEVALRWNGLPLRLRLDRVDQVQTRDGERILVMDYKTGQVDRQGWSADSLLEPQLPLYASPRASATLSLPGVDGICLARVHEHEPAFVAATNWCQRLISHEDVTESVWRKHWDEELALWQARLDQLIEDYRQGDIRHARHTRNERDPTLAAALFLVDAEDPGEEDA